MTKKVTSVILVFVLLFTAFATTVTIQAETTPSVSVSFDKTVLVVGETYTPTVTKSSSDLVLRWQLGDTGVVSVTQDGTITALSVGTVQVRVTCSAASFQQIVTLYVVDSVGVSSNESYYIMNATSERLLAPSSSVVADYSNVVTLATAWTAQMRWKIQELADGRFELYSFGSFGSSILKAFGTNIETETSENSDSEKFQIYRINHGTYEGLYQIKNGENYVAQNTAANNYNVYLTSDSTDEFSYWSFMNVEQRNAYIFDFPLSHNETSKQSEYFQETMVDLGYTPSQRSHANASSALGYMSNNSDIWVFRGHGNACIVAFDNYSGVTTSAIVADDSLFSENYTLESVGNLPDNSLNKVRCVLYLGCSTGVSKNGENLIDETYSKGAHFVLGTTQIMKSTSNSEWLHYFLEYINRGRSIEEAMLYADECALIKYKYTEDDATYTIGDELPKHACGDVKQYLDIS